MSYLDDPVFRAVRALRDPDRWAPILGRVLPAWQDEPASGLDIRVHYLNYKPFERARLALSAIGGETAELVFEVGGRPPSDAAGTAGFSVAELGAHGWALKDAPRLDGVSTLRDPEALRRIAGPALGLGPEPIEIELLRYVPRKRAVLTIVQRDKPGRLYAKLARPQDADDLASCFQAVDRIAGTGAFAFRTPKVMAYLPDLHTVFMSEVPGRPFTEVIGRADSTPFAAVGTALASLHRSGLRPEAEWTIEHQLDDLQRHLAGMARALPWLAERIDALVAQLSALAPAPFEGKGRPIHGNLFGDQILWDGSRIGIVDWDRLAWGDPLYDLGRLLAHQIYETALSQGSPDTARGCANALIGAFVRAANCRIDQARLGWHVAVELLLRAKISALRPLSTDWPEHCARAVTECERLIDGRSAFAALPPLCQPRGQVA